MYHSWPDGRADSPTVRMKILLHSLLGALLLACTAAAAPRITEFMAANSEDMADEDGDYSDWIEVENPDATPINLIGFQLSDDDENLGKWFFPSRILQPGEKLVVFASGKNRKPAVGELHTNFSLNSGGESLTLATPDGQLIQAFLDYPLQSSLHSYGIGRRSLQQTLVVTGAACRIKVPTAEIPGWTDLNFDDALWSAGQTAVGYDTKTSGVIFNPLFGVGGNVLSTMYNQRSSCYLRIPFTGVAPSTILRLKLRMKYDDGFVAYLNGIRIADRTLEGSPGFASIAHTFRPDNAAVVFEDIDISEYASLILPGANVLAIQGLNTSAGNRDFLILPELVAEVPDLAAPERTGYIPKPSPGKANQLPVDGFLTPPTFSMPRGFYDAAITVSLSHPDSLASIYFTVDGSQPTQTGGTLYSSPINISTTTVVRAAAFRENWADSPVGASSYLYVADILQQPTQPAGYPAQWGTDAFTNLPGDYQMDPAVVSQPAYANMGTMLRQSLPVVSLSVDREAMFSPAGLYADNRFTDLELHSSMEYFMPGTNETLSQACGLRIHGGQARKHAKKPFRLYFKSDYDKGKLEHPLFENSPVDRFDQLILRPGGHDGWCPYQWGNSPTDFSAHASYLRDQFLRQTELDLGHVSPRGKFVHLYLNGLYWGVYNLHERPSAQFFAAHHGGKEVDYDVVQHPDFSSESFAVQDGQAAAWTDLQALCTNGINTPGDYAAIQQYLNLDDYIDHMMVAIWAGGHDWMKPMYFKESDGTEYSVGFFGNKNWYAGRRGRGVPGTFSFFMWDAEISMGNHAMKNLGSGYPPSFGNPPAQQTVGMDSTRVSGQGGTAWPYNTLRQYPDFRVKFGDRLHANFLNNGPMSPARNLARMQALEQQLDGPIMAESARWGDALKGFPTQTTFTRDGHWRPEIAWLKNTFIAQRNEIVLNQFRSIGLYPFYHAPILSHWGGTVTSNFPLAFSHPNLDGGQMYFTVDGSDPLASGNVVTAALVDRNTPCKYFLPIASVTNWQTLAGPANLSSWASGLAAVGFDADTANLYGPEISTNLASMQNVNSSVYLRVEFNLTAKEFAAITSANLRFKYDDGFQCYLNSVLTNRTNVPGNPAWNSVASAPRVDTEVMQFTDVTLPENALRIGQNVLAVQVLNAGINDDDLLLVPELTVKKVLPGSTTATAQPYSAAIPLTQSATIKARYRAADGSWSALSEATFIVGGPANSSNLVVSEIHYHPADPSNTEQALGFAHDREFEFLELLNISNSPVELDGLMFSAGIDFHFPPQSLAAGHRVVVARNPAAFTARYGAGIPVLGPFENGTQLANDGERITLLAANGDIIFDFVYDDAAPWPTRPDGEGYSLTRIDPYAGGNPGASDQWRASVLTGGTPGAEDPETFGDWSLRLGFNPDALLDSDGDGVPNMLEFAFGTNPNLITNGPQPLSYAGNFTGNGVISMRGQPISRFESTALGIDFRALFIRRKDYAAAHLTYTPQFSASLDSWTNSTETPTVLADNGTYQVCSVPYAIFLNKKKARFFRVHVSSL